MEPFLAGLQRGLVSGLAKARRVIFQVRNVRRLTRQGARHERLGAFEIAGASLNNAEIMKRVSVVRIAFQNIAVKLGCARQVPSLVIGKRGMQFLLDVSLCHLVLDQNTADPIEWQNSERNYKTQRNG